MNLESRFVFSYDNLKAEYEALLAADYEIIRCIDYVRAKAEGTLSSRVVVNRVDIDVSVIKAGRLAEIFGELDIKASFFLRLHAPEYNPMSFENYRIVRRIVQEGHELGLHAELVDQAAIWEEDAVNCLRRDLCVMEAVFSAPIRGVASHGGSTGLNNLDFWRSRKPAEFGLEYEAYDKEPAFGLFESSFYVSDSEWTRWKAYDKGALVVGDRRTPAEHARDGHPIIYLLIHPDGYYDRHVYDTD